MKHIFISILLVYSINANAQTKKEISEITLYHPEWDTEQETERKNKLTNIIETLELEYMVWGCACPNWITVSDRQKFEETGLGIHCIFIEPASDDLELPPHFDPFKHRIIVTGQFYEKEDYPKGTIETEEPMRKAKVFRYTDIEVIVPLSDIPNE